MNLNIAETNLLLFLEDIAFEGGELDYYRDPSPEEKAILARWNESGFVQTGVIVWEGIKPKRHWVKLSDHAVEVAHRARKRRIELRWEHRGFEAQDYDPKSYSGPEFRGIFFRENERDD